ncbi:MAG: ABC transporter permease [Rubrimonas sp.]
MARRAFSVTAMPGFGWIAGATILCLYAPILVVVAYSFNAGASIQVWEGFSLHWYEVAWRNRAVQDATIRSLIVAASASAVATTVATLAALATARGRPFRGRTAVYVAINQPLMAPEIVTAVALLIVFAQIRMLTGLQGLGYLIAAHAAFCTPFAYLPIRARLKGLDPMLETAAADLYASPSAAFRRVTLPLMGPGIAAGAMLAFVISLDDVIITEFVKSAGQDTLPTYMLGQLRRAMTPEINAIATALLGATLALLTAFFLLTRRRD